MQETITITLEEYKELLMIKGKYEELKSKSLVKLNYPILRKGIDYSKTYREFEIQKTIEVTC